MYYRPELGLGEKADMDFLQSTIGLIWCTHNVVVSVIVPDGNSELDGTRVKNQTSKE